MSLFVNENAGNEPTTLQYIICARWSALPGAEIRDPNSAISWPDNPGT
jgi:hypothetical protein